MIRLFRVYTAFVRRNPLLGGSMTSGIGLGIGNAISQAIAYQRHGKQFNMYQMAQYAGFGLLFTGPFLRYWWHFLELRLFANRSTPFRPLKMVLVDQAVNPWVINVAFLYSLSITQGNSHQDACENVLQKVKPVVIAAYQVWPLANFINFYLVPLPNKALYNTSINIVWSIYMTSVITSDSSLSEAKNETDEDSKP